MLRTSGLTADHTDGVTWTPYEQMSRLEQKMFWAVREAAGLGQIAREEIDSPGTAFEQVWSAEDPAACAHVLVSWFDAGLVGVMDAETERDLPGATARALLADVGSWSDAHALAITEVGVLGLVHG